MDLPGFAADLTLVIRGIIYFTYLKYPFFFYLVFHSRKPKQPVTLKKGI